MALGVTPDDIKNIIVLVMIIAIASGAGATFARNILKSLVEDW